ncbi:MAG: carboxypeptidase regulatory-like domain-containing protein [Armatimonadetes bacterium]|nr:carboxypeptidase regulatory-like domain-containing protein [Armatimonadota bacterium]
MRNMWQWPTAAMLLAGCVALAATLAGCGGGGEGTALLTGSAFGVVRVYQSGAPVGLGNVTITINGQTGVSDATGAYRVDGITPGGPYTVTITPPTGSALPPGMDPITVQIVAGQTTVVPDVTLIDEGDLPPDPPY